MSNASTSEITIRRAEAADAALLAELGARTFHDTFAADNRPEDMAAYLAWAFTPERLSEELEDARAHFFVAEVGGEAAGYAKLRSGETHEGVKGPDAIELERLYVRQDWLGRGVGPLLMRECLAEARRRGHRTIWLGVWEHNARARAFYRRFGFRDVGAKIFVVGFDRQTDTVMERPLDEPDEITRDEPE
ncbi:MAG TPA: GNAT family N-acetyltransferase [Pyrinomonadaceae bacterium]|nr:GNAT family N-acetyltransferase [Pyrinomonadaceae bacterium]